MIMIIPENEKPRQMNNCKPFFFLLLFVVFGCSTEQIETTNFDVIPYPSSVVATTGFSSIESVQLNAADSFYSGLNPWLSTLDFKVIIEAEKEANTSITKLSDKPKGSYSLEIQDQKIEISVQDNEGLRNAFVTLLQLYRLNNRSFPIVKIEDEPRFSYRGMHLDVSRHFYPLHDIKKYIDYLAYYKYNTFHWHLTDDQGWRIEIKKYPKLHEIGGFRDETLVGHYNNQPHQFDGKKYGGYYTQEEAAEVVAYADARGIEVIPEIELPGHSLAALTAYPELGCEKKEYKVATKWGVFSDVYCPTESTIQFLQEVLTEIIEIFPSPYIHIGGDECPKTAWENSAFCQKLIKEYKLEDEHGLQSYFIGRIEKFLNGQDKMIIGWDEILEGGLAPNATVMSWRGEQGGIEAANANHEVVMTPTSHCYFDYYQSEHPDEPLAIGGYLPYEKVYSWNVIPEDLPNNKHQFIIGGQGNIWTEYLPTFDLVEYMGLTRMATLSEVLWKRSDEKDIDRFNQSLYQHTTYWKGQNVNMANHLLDASVAIEVKPGKGVFLTSDSKLDEAIKYVSTPGIDSFQLQESAEVVCGRPGVYSFYHELNGEKGRTKDLVFTPHKGNKASIIITKDPALKYSGNGPQSVVNGVVGDNDRYGGSEWLGFNGDDFEAVIDLQEKQILRSVSMRFFKGEGQWIYLPAKITLMASLDGIDYETLVSHESPTTESKIATVELDAKEFSGRYIKLIAENYGEIPSDKQGGGNPAWLFVDEIVIQ